jgi:hypothetical protein
LHFEEVSTMANGDKYWFAATPFGYGWWRPSHPLGWLALAIAIGLTILVGRLFPPSTSPLSFWSAVVGIAVAFLLVCKIKGEPLGKRRA